MRYIAVFLILLFKVSVEAQPKPISYSLDYDYTIPASQQLNPIYHNPIPEINTPLYINLQFVLLQLDQQTPPCIGEVYAATDYLNSIYQEHGIRFMARPHMTIMHYSAEGFLEDFRNSYLPEFPDQMTIYVIPGEYKPKSPSPSCSLLDDHSVIYFDNKEHFNENVAINISRMSGVLDLEQSTELYQPILDELLDDGSLNAQSITTGAKPVLQQSSKIKLKDDLDYSDLQNIYENAWSGVPSAIERSHANHIKYNFQKIDALKQKVYQIELPEGYLDERTGKLATSGPFDSNQN